MIRKVILIATAAAFAAGAWAADVRTDAGGAAYVGGPPTLGTPAGMDATMELAWDNGSRRWAFCWPTGAGYWYGNDFSTSTLTGRTVHVKILKYKFMTSSQWPNTTWDGVRIGFYNFAGGVPGSLLWPTSGSGYFFKPSTPNIGHVWVECDINWTCPTNGFVAAHEQFYNDPTADPYELDTNPTFLGHSWEYTGGTWSPMPDYSTLTPYRNLMIRVLVETGQSFPGIEPTSMGRVKALYF